MYDWLRPAFLQVERVCPRPNYAWGVLQGAALAKILGHPRISVIEFGVAGGGGLVAMEHAAQEVERLTGVGIDVYGFDTGKGLPKPKDYRDVPYMWDEGYFAMDIEKLRSRLQRAQLRLGDVATTVPEFLRTEFAPVAFFSIDVDLYTASRHALQILDADLERLLPRVSCYFDDIMGHGYNEYVGERLAIEEFNREHGLRKITPDYGLKFLVPPAHRFAEWTECMYFAHLFDHPRYGDRSHLAKFNQLDIDGNWYRT